MLDREQGRIDRRILEDLHRREVRDRRGQVDAGRSVQRPERVMPAGYAERVMVCPEVSRAVMMLHPTSSTVYTIITPLDFPWAPKYLQCVVSGEGRGSIGGEQARGGRGGCGGGGGRHEVDVVCFARRGDLHRLGQSADITNAAQQRGLSAHGSFGGPRPLDIIWPGRLDFKCTLTAAH